MSIAAIVLSVISLVLGGVNLLLMVLMCAAWKDFKENWEQLKEEVKPAKRTTSPAAPAHVGTFSTEEAKKRLELINSVLNACLKAVEVAGLTSEEAQAIPAQLEKAVAYGSAEQRPQAPQRATNPKK